MCLVWIDVLCPPVEWTNGAVDILSELIDCDCFSECDRAQHQAAGACDSSEFIAKMWHIVLVEVFEHIEAGDEIELVVSVWECLSIAERYPIWIVSVLGVLDRGGADIGAVRFKVEWRIREEFNDKSHAAPYIKGSPSERSDEACMPKNNTKTRRIFAPSITSVGFDLVVVD